MGRNEAPLDPLAGPLARFAADMRALRLQVGTPSYRVLARRAHFAASTLSIAASGRVPPSLPVVQAYVRACGGDVEAWSSRWHVLQEELRSPGESLNDVEATAEVGSSELEQPQPPGPTHEPRARPQRTGVAWSRWWGIAAATIVVVVVLAVAATGTWTGLWQRVQDRSGGQVSGHQTTAVRSTQLPIVRPVTPLPTAGLITLIAGPGCSPDPHTRVSETIRADGWTNTTGGLSACGHRARSTRTNGDVRLVEDSYTWTFLIAGMQTCTAAVWIADTPPSSSIARYEVAGGSTSKPLATLQLSQGRHKGEWLDLGTWTVRSQLRVRLTDSPSYTGGTYHVTASAARAVCVPGRATPPGD